MNKTHSLFQKPESHKAKEWRQSWKNLVQNISIQQWGRGAEGGFKGLLQQIELLDGIDTEGVEEMIYPFEAETTFLREDSVDNVISQEAALLNVKSAKAGHVHVPKVVK